MKVEKLEHGWIAAPEGYFNSDNGQAVKECFDEFMQTGHPLFALDFSSISIINSLGVAYLMEVLEELEIANRQLAFFGCSIVIERMLRLVGIDSYARIVPRRADLFPGTGG